MQLTPEQREALLATLQTRFEQHMHRHETLEWSAVWARLAPQAEKLWSLSEMERTGGNPDVIGYDEATGEYIFCDCAVQSPAGRKSICYDREGQATREKKGIHPNGNAVDMATAMGITLLTEARYRQLQQLGDFDTKTSSWIKTPPKIRGLGGALFADYRYETVFVYHNSAPSFYSSRGFRGLLRV